MRRPSSLCLSALVVLCLLALLQRSPSIELDIMHSPAGGVTLGVQTEAGVDYLIYSSPDLETWTPLGSPFPGTGGYMEIPVPSPQSAAFYRVGKPGNWNAFTWDDFAWQ